MEQRPDPVVPEVTEPEADPFDAFEALRILTGSDFYEATLGAGSGFESRCAHHRVQGERGPAPRAAQKARARGGAGRPGGRRHRETEGHRGAGRERERERGREVLRTRRRGGSYDGGVIPKLVYEGTVAT